MPYTWLSIAARTGLVIEELPGLVCGTVRQQMMAYTSASASLPLPKAPEGWARATLPYGAVIVLLDVDPEKNTEVPVWGGLVLKRTPDHTDQMDINMSTVEAYLDRRYVGDKTYTQVPQNLIVKDLVESFAATGVNGGIPIRVEITGGNGALRDRTYLDEDDKSLYSVLRELSGVLGGPEWTIRLEKLDPVDGVARFGFVFVVGDRIGVSPQGQLSPAAMFELPGSVTSFEAPEDYGSGKGANAVMAVSTASADVRPQSPVQRVTDPDRPTVEHRFTPSTSITDVDTLTSHAKAKAAQVAAGSKSISMTARALADPRLGTDWLVGDDIGYSVMSPAFPDGKTGVVRAVGWELQLTANPQVTPVLLGDDL